MRKFLITGGTGSVGRAFARHLLSDGASRIVIYSRDEQKQEELARELKPHDPSERLRYMIGDIRDRYRLQMAMHGIDVVIHTAALKIVPKCEYDPIEAVKTNVYGTQNIVQAAISAGVSKAIMLSTDKAVAPINLYGATKLTAERLFISANHLSGSPGDKNATRFSIVRYGNAANSRGSVIPLFKGYLAQGKPLPVTHPGMTRFWITIDQAVSFVIWCLDQMDGGEVFIPRMPSFRIVDLAEAIDPTKSVRWPIVGMRPGEKIHETLITSHDTPRLEHRGKEAFVIRPEWKPAEFVREDFTYSSDTNPDWLSVDDLRRMTQ